MQVSTNLHLSKWARQFFAHLWHLVTLFVAYKTADQCHALRYSEVIEHPVEDHFRHQQFIGATQTKGTELQAQTADKGHSNVPKDYTLQISMQPAIHRRYTNQRDRITSANC
jgi:hypothetical protein